MGSRGRRALPDSAIAMEDEEAGEAWSREAHHQRCRQQHGRQRSHEDHVATVAIASQPTSPRGAPGGNGI